MKRVPIFLVFSSITENVTIEYTSKKIYVFVVVVLADHCIWVSVRIATTYRDYDDKIVDYPPENSFVDVSNKMYPSLSSEVEKELVKNAIITNDHFSSEIMLLTDVTFVAIPR